MLTPNNFRSQALGVSQPHFTQSFFCFLLFPGSSLGWGVCSIGEDLLPVLIPSSLRCTASTILTSVATQWVRYLKEGSRKKFNSFHNSSKDGRYERFQEEIVANLSYWKVTTAPHQVVDSRQVHNCLPLGQLLPVVGVRVRARAWARARLRLVARTKRPEAQRVDAVLPSVGRRRFNRRVGRRLVVVKDWSLKEIKSSGVNRIKY